MQFERKRFSYLTVQQRALNSSNAIDTDKTTQSKHRSILSSNNKSHHKQQSSLNQQLSTSFSRNSSIKKTSQPLADFSQNFILQEARTSANKNLTISNKQNLNQRLSVKNDQYPITSRPINESALQARIKQLEQQNSLILKQTEDKFLQMERHLEKVQGILKEKQLTIQNLVNQNAQIREKYRSSEEALSSLTDQKQELLRIINEKNEQIKKMIQQQQTMREKQAQLLDQLNKYTLQAKMSALESVKPNQSFSLPQSFPCNQTQSISIETDLKSVDIDELILMNESQGADKLTYRQKYEALFKRALEMEDEMYRLKEELFDSQNEVQTIQQEFNTFKIFNQIEKIKLQN